ncbi:PH domain-containing protein [Geodermatophilus sp. YIM 151500]|uniref:PH domain-containing protein n=1 Tax=Geodermatophilus sp. YIM 151500 TaxID=2984531 RepID=UPI0021E35BB8|nr:PH domain-containing protein [Geodermatophilus sp. YIM 151500]MCV2488827.1 PH domain-containing protein [Geodermatophilus sp. YIM 151500]
MATPVRLRMSRTVLAPVVVFALALLPVALASPWAAPVLVVPVVLAAGLLRIGADVDDGGVTVRSLVGKRHLAWTEVSGIRVGPRTDLWLVTTRGTEVRLPVLRARDLPLLSAASGGHLSVPAPPGRRADQ